MKKIIKIRIYWKTMLLYFFLLIFFSFLIFFCQDMYLNIVQKETFTPRIRQFYRPYFRSTRVYLENFYSKHSTVFSNIFRKFI